MLPWIILENIHTVMTIFVLFEQFSREFCLNVSSLILSASPMNIMHFIGTFRFMLA